MLLAHTWGRMHPSVSPPSLNYYGEMEGREGRGERRGEGEVHRVR
jgi:hypothetical protein